MQARFRKAVSKKKRRLVIDGYDLDMAYITERIIAMGFPATGRESMYRNPYTELYNFLQEKHGNHYKVYNTCSEASRQYDPAIFHDRVSCYPFDDHNSPPFFMIEDCCNDMAEWLAEHPDNVCCVHCKVCNSYFSLLRLARAVPA